MSRRINSFGYRIGITHFWQLQRTSINCLKPFLVLSKLNIIQIINTLFFYYNYNVLNLSIKLINNNLIIYTSVLKAYSFDLLNKKSFKKDIQIFYTNFYYFFEKLFQIKKLLKYIKSFYLFIFLFYSLLLKYNYFLTNNYILINFYLLFSNNLFKFNNFLYYKKNNNYIYRNYKSSFFSFYNLKFISKKIELILNKFVKKPIFINAENIYKKLTYFNKFSISKLNLNLTFWTIKKKFKFFELLYFSCYFLLSKLIVNTIINNLSRKKKTHYFFLNFFFLL